MIVAKETYADPVLTSAEDALRSGHAAVLVAGAPGMGKSSVIQAAAHLVSREHGFHQAWISGEVVASEEHTAALLAAALGVERTLAEPLESVCRRLPRQSVLLVVDDLDALVFKRERIARALAALVGGDRGVRILASCHPGAVERLTTADGPLANVADGAAVVTLGYLDDSSARQLVRRRAPRLSEPTIERVVVSAGGHPAALVFLSRMAEVSTDTAVDALFERAAEFAGAVYAESWASLGPQQRAILWCLATVDGAASTGDIAERIGLPASHVGAQLSRLVTDGMARRTGERGRYAVAPLLARWIELRATRANHEGAR